MRVKLTGNLEALAVVAVELEIGGAPIKGGCWSKVSGGFALDIDDDEVLAMLRKAKRAEAGAPPLRDVRLSIQVNREEKSGIAAAAMAAKKPLLQWVSDELLEAAYSLVNPPRVPPTPLVPVEGPRSQGRQVVIPQLRRTEQIRVSMTSEQRSLLDEAAVAAGRKSTARWAREVLLFALI